MLQTDFFFLFFFLHLPVFLRQWPIDVIRRNGRLEQKRRIRLRFFLLTIDRKASISEKHLHGLDFPLSLTGAANRTVHLLSGWTTSYGQGHRLPSSSILRQNVYRSRPPGSSGKASGQSGNMGIHRRSALTAEVYPQSAGPGSPLVDIDQQLSFLPVGNRCIINLIDKLVNNLFR